MCRFGDVGRDEALERGRDACGDVQALSIQATPPVPEDVTLSPEADDFRKRCLAMYVDSFASISDLS